MRFTTFLVAALGFTSASAAVLEQRTLLDICANVAGQLNIRLPILGLVSLGQVNICLCVSALPLYIRTDIVGRAVVKLLGSEVDALARLNALIGSLGSNCQYPTNAIPLCSSTDPCGFQCGKGYVRQGSTCVCPANAVLCNGECKPAGTVCGSMGVAPRGISSWMDAQCKSGQEVCGVLSDGLTIAPHGFECIDTGSHKESCGGCVLPIFAKQTRGRDCTSIIGTLDVSCIDSSCVVHTCKDGFVVSDDETTCLPVFTLESGETAAGDTTTRGVSVYAGDLASSGKAASTFPKSFVARGDLSTSNLVLGALDAALTLDHKILATLDASDDPLQILLDAYAAAHAQSQSKREVNPTPIISSTVSPPPEMEGLVLVEGL